MSFKHYSDAPPRSNKRPDNWAAMTICKKITLNPWQDKDIIESIEEAKERGIKPTEWLRLLFHDCPISFRRNKSDCDRDYRYQFRLLRGRDEDMIDSINLARSKKIMPVDWLRELFTIKKSQLIYNSKSIVYYCFWYGDNMRQNDVILFDCDVKPIGIVRGKKAIDAYDLSKLECLSLRRLDCVALGHIHIINDMFNIVDQCVEFNKCEIPIKDGIV